MITSHNLFNKTHLDFSEENIHIDPRALRVKWELVADNNNNIINNWICRKGQCIIFLEQFHSLLPKGFSFLNSQLLSSSYLAHSYGFAYIPRSSLIQCFCRVGMGFQCIAIVTFCTIDWKDWREYSHWSQGEMTVSSLQGVHVALILVVSFSETFCWASHG